MNFFLVVGEEEHRTELYIKELENRSLPYKKIGWLKAINGNLPYVREDKPFIKLMSPWKNRDLVRKWQEPYTLKDPEIFHKSSEKFHESLMTIDEKIREQFEEPYYINNPESMWLARDKEKMSRQFFKKGVPHPKVFFNVESFNDLKPILQEYNELILKLRTGSLGKRLTLLTRNTDSSIQCLTNWNKYNSYTENCSWSKFYKVSNIESFINKILKFGILIQEWIKPPKIGDQYFDIRMLTIFGEVPHLYGRANTNFVTNISCGGNDLSSETISKEVPEELLKKGVVASIKASQALGLSSSGNDLIFDENYEHLFILESNAFPGIDGAIKQGFNPYGFEIDKTLLSTAEGMQIRV